jgi:hypothetical protein
LRFLSILAANQKQSEFLPQRGAKGTRTENAEKLKWETLKSDGEFF